MFVQVVQGKTNDAEGLRRQVDRWQQEIKPGSVGYVGSTGGVTDGGTAIFCVRFESEEAARRNSDRPEQGQWWAETEKYFEGPVTFHDCSEVIVHREGGSDKAGFVQIIQGRAKDEARVEEIGKQFDAKLPDLRPDVLGGYTARHGDGGFTDVNYFTSEAEARKGESQVYPDDVKALFDEWMSLIDDVEWIDLKNPWLHGA